MRIKKLLSMVLCITLMMAIALPASAAENNPKSLSVIATDCNVELTFSDDGQFSYDYDNSIYKVTTQTTDSVTTINITKKSDLPLEMNVVKIKVPDILYEQVDVTANSSGVNLPAFKSDISIVADKSSISAVIPADYSKTCSYQAANSSGGIVFQENATNYKYSMKASGSAVSLPSSWTRYPNYGSYTYQSGESTGIIDVDITGCSFFVTI